jgi:hypothetical protein
MSLNHDSSFNQQMSSSLTQQVGTSRHSRVGNNQKNKCSESFFLGDDGGKPLEVHKREQIESRNQFKRDWLAQIDNDRWCQMGNAYTKKEQMYQSRRTVHQRGQSSVSYDIISLNYQSNERGKQLAELDEKAKVLLVKNSSS